jgi:adenylosuccinate lyase
MALVKAGADRQEMHERLRGHAMKAWEAIRTGGENPLTALLCKDAILTEYLSEEDIRRLMDARSHVGDAPARAREMAKAIAEIV